MMNLSLLQSLISALLIILSSSTTLAAFNLKNDAKVYRISNYDQNKVLVKRNNKEYKINRTKFALKKFKINQAVKIHDVGLKLHAQQIKIKK